MVSVERRSARLAQWILYLALSTSIGFAWTGLYLAVASTFQFLGSEIFSIVEQVLPTALATSFCAGLLYRILAIWKGRTLSNWFAGLIPGIGAICFVLCSDISYYALQGKKPFLERIFPALVITYLCAGIVLIPLSIPHAMALERLHRQYTAWAPQASVRSIRHVAYGTLCGLLLLVTEGTRFWEMKRREEMLRSSSYFGIALPERATLLSRRDEVDSRSHIPVIDAHFRIPGGTAWPPREDAVAVTLSDPARDVRSRFEKVTGHRVPSDAKLEQVKWYEGGAWFWASRLHTRQADYVELRQFSYKL
jgi:hypothetical protein